MLIIVPIHQKNHTPPTRVDVNEPSQLAWSVAKLIVSLLSLEHNLLRREKKTPVNDT